MGKEAYRPIGSEPESRGQSSGVCVCVWGGGGEKEVRGRKETQINSDDCGDVWEREAELEGLSRERGEGGGGGGVVGGGGGGGGGGEKEVRGRKEIQMNSDYCWDVSEWEAELQRLSRKMEERKEHHDITMTLCINNSESW